MLGGQIPAEPVVDADRDQSRRVTGLWLAVERDQPQAALYGRAQVIERRQRAADAEDGVFRTLP
jgi:hypothetical protein